jgi:peptidoglycan/LPS O-acetylase OafA/YrhL
MTPEISAAGETASATTTPAPTGAPERIQRIRFLDGIRGWASLQVALYHLIPTYLAAASPTFAGWSGKPFDGRLAIYLFFVVSGFALSIGFIETGDRKMIETLAIRRYPRLVIPILGCAIFAYVLMSTGAMHNLQVAKLLGVTNWPAQTFSFEPSALHVLQFSFYDVFFDNDQSRSYNTALWTMPIELYGSAMVFAFLYICRSRKIRWCLYPVFIIVAWKCDSPYTAFAFGVLLCETFVALGTRRLETSRGIIYGSLVCIALGLFLITFGRLLYGHPGFLSLCGLLFVAGISLNPWLRLAFSARISRVLGKLSFPLYLVHLSVIGSLSSWLFLYLTSSGAGSDTAVIITVALSVPALLLTAAAFYPIEAFAVNFSRMLSTRVMALLYSRKALAAANLRLPPLKKGD